MRSALSLLLTCGPLLAQVPVSGFVDSSMRYELDPESLGFSVDQVELDLQRTENGNLLLRTDLDFGDDGLGGWAATVEQAFLRLDLPVPAALMAGRFNAPIGFESLDAPDMFQYSHALVFDYGLPVNFTGARLDVTLPAELDLKLILANGWDNNTDSDMEKTFAGRLGGQFGELGLGVSWIADAEVNGDDSQLVFDADATWVHGALRMGAEYNTGTTSTAGGQDLGWSGVMLMGHYDITEKVGLTLRFDHFDDGDNLRLGEFFADTTATDTLAQGLVRTAFTIAPTFVLGERLGAVIEYRMDTIDNKAWIDDDEKPTDISSSITFELTCGF